MREKEKMIEKGEDDISHVVIDVTKEMTIEEGEDDISHEIDATWWKSMKEILWEGNSFNLGEDDISHEIYEKWLKYMNMKGILLEGNSSNGGGQAGISSNGGVDTQFIYRVTQAIRTDHEAAYDPKIVSIGPYHRGKKNLQAMEEQKWRYLRDLMDQNQSRFENCFKKITELEKKARGCYSEDLSNIGSSEFVGMMLLDGCFILNFFLKYQPLVKKEPIFTKIWMPATIYHDLLLVENQLPFFILSSLFELLFMDGKIASSAEELIGLFFNRNKEIPRTEEIHHLLHFLHMAICPTENSKTNPQNSQVKSWFKKLKNLFPSFLCHLFSTCHESSSENQSPRTIPSATVLQEAGVRFKKTDSRSFLDIKFRHGVMEIPSILIDLHSDSLFRNLITFEQFCIPKSEITYVTRYAFFMDCIINTSEDIAILQKNGIIEHMLGSNEKVATLFNELGKDFASNLFNALGKDFAYNLFNVRNHYLSDVYKEVDRHCQAICYKWWASLKRDYFSNPWVSLSVLAAIVLLGLTATQTFFSVYDHFRPP